MGSNTTSDESKLDLSVGSESEDSSLSDALLAEGLDGADWSGYYTDTQIATVFRANGFCLSDINSPNWLSQLTPLNTVDQFQTHAYLPTQLTGIGVNYFTYELLNYINAMHINGLAPANRRFVIPVNIPLNNGYHWALLAVQLENIDNDVWSTLSAQLNTLDDTSTDNLTKHQKIVENIQHLYQDVKLILVDSLKGDHIADNTKVNLLENFQAAYPEATINAQHEIPFLQTNNNCAKHAIAHGTYFLNHGELHSVPSDIAVWESELEAHHKAITTAQVFELEEFEETDVLDVADSNLFGRWNLVALENYVNENTDLFDNLQVEHNDDGSIASVQVAHHYDGNKTVTYTSTATGGLSFPTTDEEAEHKERAKHGILLLLASKGVENPGVDDAYAYKFTLKTDKPEKQQWFQEVCNELKVTYYSTPLTGDSSTPKDSPESEPKPRLELGDPKPEAVPTGQHTAPAILAH